MEHAIHNHWSGDAALTAFVPDERFVTGFAQGEIEKPYVTLVRVATRTRLRTSDRVIDEAEFRFDIWSDTLTDAKDVAVAITSRFDRQTFSADGEDVLRMRQTGREETQSPEDASWRIAMTFIATAERT